MTEIGLTVFGICFIFIMTTLGSAFVFFFKGEISQKTQSFFLGLASGVMVAASIWSLILPAIDTFAVWFGKFAFIPAVVSLLLGGLFLVFLDVIFPLISRKTSKMNTSLEKPFRLFLAVTFHNIPEGLAVGFAFGTALVVGTPVALVGALGLAIGIGVQNFPEGMAVALPIKTVLKSNKKAFLWGMSSGIAEPIFACLGVVLASKLQALQPWLLTASAGAMIFVSAEDLIPDARSAEAPKMGAWGVLIGFVLMMALDVALG